MSERENVNNKLLNAIENERLKKVIKEARDKWAKIKGYYITIPDYEPKTEIFIRENQNVLERIALFKKNNMRSKDILAKKALEKKSEITIKTI